MAVHNRRQHRAAERLYNGLMLTRNQLLPALVFCIIAMALPCHAKPRIAVLPAHKVETETKVTGLIYITDQNLVPFTAALTTGLSLKDVFEVVPITQVQKFLDEAKAKGTNGATLDDLFRNANGFELLRCDGIVVPSLRCDQIGPLVKVSATAAVVPPGKISYTWGNGILPFTVLKLGAKQASDSKDKVISELLKAAASELVEQIDSVVARVPESAEKKKDSATIPVGSESNTSETPSASHLGETPTSVKK